MIKYIKSKKLYEFVDIKFHHMQSKIKVITPPQKSKTHDNNIVKYHNIIMPNKY
jgi:hypothetical protein